MKVNLGIVKGMVEVPSTLMMVLSIKGSLDMVR